MNAKALTNEERQAIAEDAIREELRRDKGGDVAKMKMPTAEELAHVDTVEEFKTRPPSFVIGEIFVDCNIEIPYNGKKSYVAGQRIVVTPIMYHNLNRSRPCIRPADIAFRDVYNPYDGQDLTGKTLFAWRAGGIGDLIFIRPLLIHLKEKYGCKIMFATKKQYHDLVQYWDDAIDELCDINFDVDKTMMVADYHLTFEGAIERIKESNEIDVHDVFAKLAGVDPDEVEWCKPISTPIDNAFFAGNTGRYVVVQPRASAPIRTPFMGSFISAVNAATRRGYRVIVADGAHAMRAAEDFRSACESPDMVINFAKYTKGLHDAVELVNRASFVVSPDSAFTHLAAMQGVPCVALYGAFPAKVRTERYPLCIPIEPPPSNCCKFGGRECFLHAPNGKCESQYACWNNLDNELVAKTVGDLIDTLEADSVRSE